MLTYDPQVRPVNKSCKQGFYSHSRYKRILLWSLTSNVQYESVCHTGHQTEKHGSSHAPGNSYGSQNNKAEGRCSLCELIKWTKQTQVCKTHRYVNCLVDPVDTPARRMDAEDTPPPPPTPPPTKTDNWLILRVCAYTSNWWYWRLDEGFWKTYKWRGWKKGVL